VVPTYYIFIFAEKEKFVVCFITHKKDRRRRRRKEVQCFDKVIHFSATLEYSGFIWVIIL
jgi:hypothetical protein